MNDLRQLNERQLEESINPDDVRGLIVLHGAFAAGIFMFSVVVVFLGLTQSPPENQPPDMPKQEIAGILTAIHVALTLGAWTFSALIFGKLLSNGVRSTLESTGESFDLEKAMGSLMGAFRGAWIMRIAFLEGAALFGLVTCLIASLGGEMGKQPLYWLNLAGPAIFLLFAAASFPTAPRIAGILHEQVSRPR